MLGVEGVVQPLEFKCSAGRSFRTPGGGHVPEWEEVAPGAFASSFSGWGRHQPGHPQAGPPAALAALPLGTRLEPPRLRGKHHRGGEWEWGWHYAGQKPTECTRVSLFDSSRKRKTGRQFQGSIECAESK